MVSRRVICIGKLSAEMIKVVNLGHVAVETDKGCDDGVGCLRAVERWRMANGRIDNLERGTNHNDPRHIPYL